MHRIFQLLINTGVECVVTKEEHIDFKMIKWLIISPVNFQKFLKF